MYCAVEFHCCVRLEDLKRELKGGRYRAQGEVVFNIEEDLKRELKDINHNGLKGLKVAEDLKRELKGNSEQQH